MTLSELPAIVVDRVEQTDSGLAVHGRFDRLDGVRESGCLETPKAIEQSQLNEGPAVGNRIIVPWWGYVLGVFELLGGLAGIGYCATAADGILAELTRRPTTAMVWWGMAVLIGLLYGTAAAAGLFLLLGKYAGWIMSRFVQAIQIVQFQALGVHYAFSVGAVALIALGSDGNADFHCQLGGEFSIGVGVTASLIRIGVNGLALIWFALLLSPARARGVAGATEAGPGAG